MLKTMKIINSTVNGPLESQIATKLKALNPQLLKFTNDSSKHSHHRGMDGASNIVESHFRIEIVSDQFKGLSLANRHRSVFKLLDDEFKVHGLHSLVLKTKSCEEFEISQT